MNNKEPGYVYILTNPSFREDWVKIGKSSRPVDVRSKGREGAWPFCAPGEDYPNLLNAARKAVEHGYRVYILPNPKGFRTADFIFERKGVYKMFDLKTIIGRNSIDNRLSESIGQTNRVLLNMAVEYTPSALARSIKHFFESNPQAIEVLVFKGKKQLSVTRKSLEDNRFFQTFIRRYTK